MKTSSNCVECGEEFDITPTRHLYCEACLPDGYVLEHECNEDCDEDCDEGYSEHDSWHALNFEDLGGTWIDE